MRKKQERYIDIERSTEDGNRGRKNIIFIFICFVLLAAGIGLAVFYFMKPNTPNNQDTDEQIAVTPTIQASSISPTVTPTVSPTVAPSVSPTQPPTSQPAKPVVSDDVYNETSDTEAASETIRGIYVPARTAGSDRMKELVKLADKTEINAMVIDIKDDHGRISYDMDSSLAQKIGSVTNTIPDINSMIQTLKEKKIYLIARIVAFKDPYLADQCPDMAILNKDGTVYVDSNGEAWVNPYNKKVWDYLVEIATQAAAVGFDEIQFDYIRFSTSKAIDQANFGEDAEGISKEAIITEFTKYAYEKLKPLDVMVSADVYGAVIASSVDAGRVGQNYVQMAKYLDYICPMIYPSHFAEGNFGIKYPDMEPFQIISAILSRSEEKLKELPESEHHAIVRPWLQDFTATWIKHHLEYGGDEIREQIEGVYSVGYDEWLLWNSGSHYSEEGLLEE